MLPISRPGFPHPSHRRRHLIILNLVRHAEGCRMPPDNGPDFRPLGPQREGPCQTVFCATRLFPILLSVAMPMNFTQYIAQISSALHEEDGPKLGHLIRPTSPHGKDLVKEYRNATVRDTKSGCPPNADITPWYIQPENLIQSLQRTD